MLETLNGKSILIACHIGGMSKRRKGVDRNVEIDTIPWIPH